LAPELLVPGHCTGWRAQHTLAAALPDSWVLGSSGTLPAHCFLTCPAVTGADEYSTQHAWLE
jgi:7,8-dihydropterin-6-yl-methyl-4-(beta-D-ribofuranosyl)aminobenzene 5'-phosphate synthase